MNSDARRELVKALRAEYLDSSKAGKTALLEAFIKSTGYARKYAISVLNSGRACAPLPRRVRSSSFGPDVEDALIKVWIAGNRICSKRLHPFLRVFLNALQHHGHLKISAETQAKLLTMSVATMDRLLKSERKKHARGRSTTKPGSLLKRQIAIRTFADWNDTTPGFLEADLVAHCGETTKGTYLNTLTLTDIETGWTECLVLPNKTESAVAAALSQVVESLPFPMKGFDSDNGSEFINSKILGWCEQRKVTFTRSREYKKNDQAHVEEKNGSIVRRFVGYDRFEGDLSLRLMTKLYKKMRLYVNFFQPSMKLCAKQRDGGKVSKTYKEAKTPCQRLVEANANSALKARLDTEFRSYDPLLLLREIEDLQIALWRTSVTIKPGDIAEGSLLKLFQLEPPATANDVIERLSIHRQDLRKKRKKVKVSYPQEPVVHAHFPTEAIRQWVRKQPPGRTFKATDIAHLANRANADSCLSRMVRTKDLVKAAWGRYAVPGIASQKNKGG